ncbi:MAG: chromosome segregation protein SMC [Halobacteriales archaeon SW_8_66_22]|nr:MAG: chromosome segregation protein SMC [Halobacteriales archaeon SW_8_66_22]
MGTTQRQESAKFAVENVGGISRTDVEIPPGVTLLTGKNATNRTSFLQAIMAAMGSTQPTLKGDTDEGRVELTLGDETYTRTLTRTGENGVRFEGEPYLANASVADRFAFLLETNDARRAVAGAEDLRDLIMEPIDVEAIKQSIRQLEQRKNGINDQLATIESRKQELPELEQRRTTLQNQIEDKRDELAELEKRIDESSRDIEESREEKAALEERLDELRSTRSDLDSVRRSIESQEQSITSLKQERADIEDELADLPDAPMSEGDHLEDDIQRLRERRQRLNTELSDLQSLIQYNEERTEQGDFEVAAALGDDDGALTDELVDDQVVCWTCGSTVDREQIDATVEQLKNLHQEKTSELSDLKDELDKLKRRQREATRHQNRREDLQQNLEKINAELDRRQETLTELKGRREELTGEIERLEAEVDDLESEEFDEVLELHRDANQLEFDIDSLENDLEAVSEKIAEVETMIEDAEDLRVEREEVLEDLEAERTKIDRIEMEAVEEFNEHMDAVLEMLNYENLDRIWIERVERTVREGRQTVDRTAFDLHVVRTTGSGVAYEDTVDHLSESEREVTGLVFALAGYLVHDLHEDVPFMLLDSLEAIDADRIAALVDYIADYAKYLVVALLEEDARALDADYHRVTEI